MMKKFGVFTIMCLIATGVLVFNFGRSFWHPYYLEFRGSRTVDDVIQKYGADAEQRLLPYFEKASADYPPEKISMIAFKDSNILQLWAHYGDKTKFIREYAIRAASGELGPKLREGDKQVPEGIYNIDYFNPNSAYHLSMKLNYPNQFDLKYAKAEGRDRPGTNIFIHGKAVSIGCLAMGDAAIEELFTLSHTVTRSNIKIVIAPSDPLKGKMTPPPNSPEWVQELYQQIETEINAIRVN